MDFPNFSIQSRLQAATKQTALLTPRDGRGAHGCPAIILKEASGRILRDKIHSHGPRESRPFDARVTPAPSLRPFIGVHSVARGSSTRVERLGFRHSKLAGCEIPASTYGTFHGLVFTRFLYHPSPLPGLFRISRLFPPLTHTPL